MDLDSTIHGLEAPLKPVKVRKKIVKLVVQTHVHALDSRSIPAAIGQTTCDEFVMTSKAAQLPERISRASDDPYSNLSITSDPTSPE